MSWLNEKGQDKRKCPAHNFWMRKGQCELCLRAAQLKQIEDEKLTGSHKPKVLVKTIK